MVPEMRSRLGPNYADNNYKHRMDRSCSVSCPMENLVLTPLGWPRCKILERLMVYFSSYIFVSNNNRLLVVKCCSFLVFWFFNKWLQFLHFIQILLLVDLFLFGVKIKTLTPNDLQIRRKVSPLKIKIPSKKYRQTALYGRI
jgi:hypothetical protein